MKKVLVLTVAILLMSATAAFAVVGAEPPPEGMMGITAVGAEAPLDGEAAITATPIALETGTSPYLVYPVIAGLLLIAAAGTVVLMRKKALA